MGTLWNKFFVVLAATCLSALGNPPAAGQSGVSAGERYATVYTARIAEGENVSEAQRIAREMGSVEVISFKENEGPGPSTTRRLVRLGEPKYGYPGFSFWPRPALESASKRGLVALDPQANVYRTSDSSADQAIWCKLPSQKDEPLLGTVHVNGALRMSIRLLETRTQESREPWPAVCHITVPGKGVIIQVFDYSANAPAPANVPMVSSPDPQPLPEFAAGIVGADGPRATDTVSFQYNFGHSYDWDTCWQPGGNCQYCPGGFPVQVRFAFGAGLALDTSVSGTFDWASAANLCVGPGSGSLRGDVGANLSARASVDVWIIDPFCFNIPYVPNFDLRARCDQSFNSFLLDSTTYCRGTVGPAQLLCANLVPIPYVTAGLCADAAMTLEASMTCDSMTTSAGQTFTSENQCRSATAGCEYHASVTYNENLNLSATVTLYPTLRVCVDIWPYPCWDWAPVAISWRVVSQKVDIPFSTSNLDFSLPHTVSTPTTPSGPSTRCVNESGSYSTGSATCSCGHSVAYQFDWGDGSQSSWGPSSASHSWSSAGTSCVKARARCTTDTSKISPWSPCRNVTVSNPRTWCRDADGDGYGNPNNTQSACAQPSGYVGNCDDCNDNDASIHPGATEVCDQKDNDCDGQVDEGNIGPTWYQDADGDGYGNPNSSIQRCQQPSGYVANNTDCNDSDDGSHPGATEVCDGKDNDCDGQTDEGNIGPTWYRDADGDGYGNPNNSTQACTQPSGYVSNHDDCDDNCASCHPGGTEVCDGKDNDCDGQTDEQGAVGCTTYYRDHDNDTYGVSGDTRCLCAADGEYRATQGGDCNDSDPSIHPGATEVCDGKDNDCDGQVDEGLSGCTPTWYRDADGDGYGNPHDSKQATTQPPGYVPDNTDCNDNDANIHPGTTEVCDGKDNDCDGQIDEGAVPRTWCRDVDGDGYGNPNDTQSACTQPSGYVENCGDCNDSDASVHPGATEVCDGKDNDCDGQTDEGSIGSTWYRDADGDGYGNPNAITLTQCTQPAGYVFDNTDCDDADATVHPGATDICGDGIDQNCSGADLACPRGACCVGENCQVLPPAACASQGGTYKGDGADCSACGQLVANAGPDQELKAPDAGRPGFTMPVTLDGSGSTGNIRSYEWTEDGELIGTAKTLARDFATGTHTIKLTVTDDQGRTSFDTMTVKIGPLQPSERTLTLHLSGPGEVRVNGNVELSSTSGVVQIGATFSNGDTVTLSASTVGECDQFVRWMGNLTSSQPDETIVMDSDKEVTAEFRDRTVQIDVCTGSHCVFAMLLAYLGYVSLQQRRSRSSQQRPGPGGARNVTSVEPSSAPTALA